MSLVVVGSVAFDNVQTPLEKRENLIGGSASHFAVAAAFFGPVQLVAVVGQDWPEEHTKMLESRGIDTKGLVVEPGAKTFTWSGKYLENMNDRETLDVQLNAFATFDPKLPEEYTDCEYLFLANTAPSIQREVLKQCKGPKLTVADTMDFYIETARDDLLALLKEIDGLVLNDSEAKLLTGDNNLVFAGHAICEMGPRFVIIKKGEHGSMFFSEHETYVLPAYPTADVEDPTGAGDSFGGGMMGYLAREGNFEPNTLKKAMAYGTMTASFNVEDFSFDRLKQVTLDDIDRRMEEYLQMLRFEM